MQKNVGGREPGAHVLLAKYASQLGYAIGVIEGLMLQIRLNEDQESAARSAAESLRQMDLSALVGRGPTDENV
jgi:hypothetical protein